MIMSEDLDLFTPQMSSSLLSVTVYFLLVIVLLIEMKSQFSEGRCENSLDALDRVVSVIIHTD